MNYVKKFFSTNLKIVVYSMKISEYCCFEVFFKTVSLLYCLFLLILSYLQKSLILNNILFLSLSIIISAFIIVFMNKGYVYKILFCSFFFLFYLTVFYSFSKSVLALTANSEDIVAVEGELLNDQVTTDSGYYFLKMKVSTIYLKNKVQLSSSGRVNILLRKNYHLLQTSYLKVEGKFSENLFIGNDIKSFSKKRNFTLSKKKNNLSLDEIKWNIRIIRSKLIKLIYHFSKSSLSRMLLLGKSDQEGFVYKKNALKAGCPHLLALSGMHLTYISLFFSFIPIRLFGKVKGKRVSIIFPLLFVFIAGSLPSLIRAGFMYCFSITLLNKKDVEIFLLSIEVQLMLFPFHLFEIGFILSYAAIIGLLFYRKLFCKTNIIIKFILPTVFVLLFTYPISTFINGEWNILSLIISPLGAILITFAMILSLLSFNFSFLVFLIKKITFNSLLDSILDFFITLFDSIINKFDNLIVIIEKYLLCIFHFSNDCMSKIPNSLKGFEGYKLFYIIVLTILAMYMYSSITLRYRRKEKYELELSIRFTKCNN